MNWPIAGIIRHPPGIAGEVALRLSLIHHNRRFVELGDINAILVEVLNEVIDIGVQDAIGLEISQFLLGRDSWC